MAYKIYFYDNECDSVGIGCLASSYLQYRLQEAQGMDIEIHISSLGGSAFDAVAIYNMLKGYSGKVTTIIDSVAASAAATVFMAGTERIISKYGLLMIHKASTISVGTSDDLSTDAKMLDAIEANIISIYVDATGMDEAAITALVNDTTWMNAEEALQMGFATSINDYSEVDNQTVVYNNAQISKSISSVPNKYQSVLNKVLTIQPDEEMKTEDKELIEKNNSLFNKVMNFFKKATIETTTNKGKLKSFAPLNVGVSVLNEDDTDTEDGEYEIDNEGKKVKMKVKGGKVENMESEDVDNSTDEEKATNLVLNSVNIKVTNKADGAAFAKVVTNHVNTINEQNALIIELKGQLDVSNKAVERDEAKIKEDIKSEFTPEGSKRSNTAPTNKGDSDLFKPTGSVAQNAVKRALNSAPGIVK